MLPDETVADRRLSDRDRPWRDGRFTDLQSHFDTSLMLINFGPVLAIGGASELALWVTSRG
jgi:hypothetical protein